MIKYFPALWRTFVKILILVTPFYKCFYYIVVFIVCLPLFVCIHSDTSSNYIGVRLSRLLFFSSGGYIRDPHRIQGTSTNADESNSTRVFGYFLVQLPSLHEGGEIIIQFRGEESKYIWDANSADTICYAAFYSDSSISLEPIVSGMSLYLVFTLTCSERHYPPTSVHEIKSSLRSATIDWLADHSPPEKLFYFLDHPYDPGTLSFDGLIGRDAAVLEMLSSLNHEDDVQSIFDVHLACIQCKPADLGSAKLIAFINADGPFPINKLCLQLFLHSESLMVRGFDKSSAAILLDFNEYSLLLFLFP